MRERVTGFIPLHWMMSTLSPQKSEYEFIMDLGAFSIYFMTAHPYPPPLASSVRLALWLSRKNPEYILFMTILHFYLMESLGNFWLSLMYERL